jgi:GTP-binding protein
MEFMEWLGENGVPFSIVFTKVDKLSKTAAESNIAKYKRKLLEQWEELPPIFITSSETGLGRDDLLNYFEELNELPVQTESGDHDE